MVALGSSYAAGPGIPPIADRAASRSAANYPHLVATALGAQLTDATVSGATTDTILHSSQRTLRRRFPPQIESVDPATDLVTITAGGNDLGYIGGVMATGISNRFARSRMLRPLVRRRRQVRALLPPPAEAVERVVGGLASIVEEVRHRAPDATVVLVDYLPVFDRVTPIESTGFSAAEVDHFRRIAHLLSGAYGDAARATGALLVPASAFEDGHGTGSADPWVSSLRLSSSRKLGSSYHPTPAGMQAVATALISALGGA